jgi:hypothetical protein
MMFLAASSFARFILRALFAQSLIAALVFFSGADMTWAAEKPAMTSFDEQKIMREARTSFENKKFEQAVSLYAKIPTSSDRWFLAVEEKAWAYMRMDQYDKALAELKTLTSPVFAGLVGTEPFLMKALIYLRSCDYVGVFDSLKEFKTLKKNQLAAIQNLAKTGANEASGAAMQKWMQNPDDWRKLGPDLNSLPLLFFHDREMLRLAKSKDLGGLQRRLQDLAKVDQADNFRVVQKLNLIEIEAIQRVHLATKFDRVQGAKVERDADDLVFKDDGDVWIDELNSYRAQLDRCERKSGRTL